MISRVDDTGNDISWYSTVGKCRQFGDGDESAAMRIRSHEQRQARTTCRVEGFEAARRRALVGADAHEDRRATDDEGEGASSAW